MLLLRPPSLYNIREMYRQSGFGCFITYKLVSADNSSLKYTKFRYFPFACLFSFSISSSDALNVDTFIPGITPGSYPKLVASISCCNASVERTTSPILISAFNEPAIPVLITASTLKYVASICVHIAAFTFRFRF